MNMQLVKNIHSAEEKISISRVVVHGGKGQELSIPTENIQADAGDCLSVQI
jgi:hypothetical protein